ncbi:hypothetical protein LK08_19515 [Streptomyces sp. MUSC 125]|uniref:hypothetical protein n=1 Tax=Streptomyces sp. MUSC 125 TaxID=1428624 RepID=UPI0005807477|nr:hypothetical protein [Streptomyces sp. MUSC 125]KIE25390.1 hypothetical protein LK08_19515 [Streptomyces sp. MUSC 125]
MTQPPQDGPSHPYPAPGSGPYGDQPSNGQQQPGPYGQQPQQPQQPGPYGPPQPPYGGQPGPYGQQQPGPYGQQPQQPGPYGPPQPPYGGQPGPYGQQQPFGQPPYPPQPPAGDPGKKKRLALVVGSLAAAAVLIAGGVYLATSRGGGGGPLADESPSASASASESASPVQSASPVETEDPVDEPSADNTWGDETSRSAAPATGFVGQWQDSGGKTLTIGEKYASGDYKGKNSVNLIDPGGDGILLGLGLEHDNGTMRIALKPISSKKASDLRAATLTRSGDDVKVDWDKGGTDTLAWNGD